MKKPKVGIVLVNWNNHQDTIECLKSLSKIDYKNSQILVVDNGSNNNGPDKILHTFKHVDVVKLKSNFGFAEGSNVGAKRLIAKNCDYLLFLNNDTTVEPDFLSKMVETMLSTQKIGIVGSLIYFMNDPKKLWFAGGKINLHEGEFSHEYELSKGNEKKPFETGYVTGCCLLIKTKDFTDVNGFDKDYGSYVEDVDLNYKVQSLGLKIFIEPKAKIYHKISASSGGDFSATKEYLKSRNSVLFARKNLVGRVKYRFVVAYLLKRIAQCIKFIKWSQYHLVTACVRGFFSGLLVPLK